MFDFEYEFIYSSMSRVVYVGQVRSIAFPPQAHQGLSRSSIQLLVRFNDMELPRPQLPNDYFNIRPSAYLCFTIVLSANATYFSYIVLNSHSFL